MSGGEVCVCVCVVCGGARRVGGSARQECVAVSCSRVADPSWLLGIPVPAACPGCLLWYQEEGLVAASPLWQHECLQWLLLLLLLLLPQTLVSSLKLISLPPRPPLLPTVHRRPPYSPRSPRPPSSFPLTSATGYLKVFRTTTTSLGGTKKCCRLRPIYRTRRGTVSHSAVLASREVPNAPLLRVGRTWRGKEAREGQEGRGGSVSRSPLFKNAGFGFFSPTTRGR